jgi:hypothetical protein
MPSLGGQELIVILAVYLLLMFFYVRTLDRTLSRCSAEARAIRPELLWLMLIPGFSLVWHFWVVLKVTESLHNEFLRRNITDVPRYPGRGTGLATCILSICLVAATIALAVLPATSSRAGPFVSDENLAISMFVATLANYAGLAALVCWIVYWVKISRYTSHLELMIAAGQA